MRVVRECESGEILWIACYAVIYQYMNLKSEYLVILCVRVRENVNTAKVYT